MTKQVRIENADTSLYGVRVHVEQQDAEFVWRRIRTHELKYPTAMLPEYIHATQRLIIEEGEFNK